MAFQYPKKNSAGTWDHGQEVKMTVGGREVVVAKYDAKKNLWQHLQVNEAGVFNFVYACQIIIDRDECPADPCLETISWDNIKDVQTALDWIYLRLQELFEKVELLEERVKQNEIDIDFLYKTLSAIDNLADVAEFLERLELIEAQLPVYADEIRQGSRVNGRVGQLFVSLDDYVPPPGVEKGTQQETNSYLWDYISKVTYFGENAPAPDQIEFTFWYDTTRLELFINYNGVWFPVSVPPKDYDLEVSQLSYSVNRLQALLDELYLFTQTTDDKYVKKVGGDEMQGPFKILHNPNYSSVRDSRRISALGLFSDSENTALRLGTTRDRIYIGHDDTAFNGLVKIDEIGEKNAGNSVKFKNDIKMGINQIKNLAEATDDKDAVTYGQIKQELADLRDEFIQATPSSGGGPGRKFEFGFAGDEGEFHVDDFFWYFNAIDLDGVKLVHDQRNFSWTIPPKMTIWDTTDGSLMAAVELGTLTDYSPTVLRFYKERSYGYNQLIYRNLIGGTIYRVTIEGYF